jgi:putative oxidoreductase
VNGKTLDAGLLVLRLGLGGMFIAHGWPKLAGGAAKWAKLGQAMGHLGIDVWPTMWGFLAAMSETVGGLFFAVGMLFRPATAMLLATMFVATATHLGKGDGIMGASHAIEMGIVFAAMLLVGPGAFALDEKLGFGRK